MTEPRRRGRPRSTGGRECGRCHHLVPKIRTHWPEGPICGPCFTAAARTYGQCAFCAAQRLLPGRSPTGEDICRDCAGITTNLDCVNCGREAERLRGGHCARCVVAGDLEQILKPHAPPDMRIKRLITKLAAVPRPESIITWMRNPVTADLLAKIGTRELQLTHDAFDALPASRSREHLREMLVHHRMMPSRGDRQLIRFEAWLDRRLQTLQPTPGIHTPIEQFARWHHLHRLRENTDPTRNMDYAPDAHNRKSPKLPSSCAGCSTSTTPPSTISAKTSSTPTSPREQPPAAPSGTSSNGGHAPVSQPR